jgi:ABC-2 type transport system ATP-binding protein
MMESEVAIRCRGLVKRFGETVAVAGLDLMVRRGECFGVLGPNGAGKTTTIEILEGLQHPDAGEVEILGMNWRRNARELRPRIGVQLQETELPDKLTVAETVQLFRSLYPRGRSVDELLGMVDLDEKRTTQVRHLSGGQRQRLSLVCTLAGDPAILFLDEPTTGLDPQSRRRIWEICMEFRAAGGTVLLTTHFMDEAERLADRIAIMDHGRVLVEGTPRDLIASLGGEHVVEFSAEGELPADDLLALPAVIRADPADGGFRLTTSGPHSTVPALFRLLETRQMELTGLRTHHATLDDVFLTQTGKMLRDN